MSYGMSYDEFWHGDIRAHRMYREANKYKMMQQNTMNWILGSYVYQAIGAWSPILRAFSKARRPGEYLEEPFDLFAEERRRKEERKARERYERIRRNVETFSKTFNEKRKKETDGEIITEQTPERKEVDDA